jgi:hypothetical protein
MARTIGQLPAQILVVGCEPETLGGDDGRLGLSETVNAAVDRAVAVVESLATRISGGEQIKEMTECN